MRAGVLPYACNMFDGMPAAGDEDYMENLIFEDDTPAAGYDPDETQSQDGRGAFTLSTFDQDQAAFMRDQVGVDLDGFPLDHEFLEDYGQEEEDECDIEGEPLFEDELANQAAWAKPKRKSKQTKTYTVTEDKTRERHRHARHGISSFGGIQGPTQCKRFNLSHCFRVIKDEEKFKAQYAALKSRGGKQAVKEVRDGEKARSWGKTNSKKEDKRDAASNALITSVEGMMSNKDSREEE
ncbi:Eyes absent-like protein 4 [Hordeum vulgare]|nr:Eyes absent-like protein 4 [Hordeum vulgare]